MWLKRWTPMNIVIGGAAGALPPMVGYAAATGEINLASVVLFAIIFMWTPPHFWSLALLRSEDYARAGVPMLPNVAGEDRTRLEILIYALALAPLGVAPWLMGFASLAYGLVSIGCGIALVGRRGGWSSSSAKATRRVWPPAGCFCSRSSIYSCCSWSSSSSRRRISLR